jgi:hypothetical protein
MPKPNEPLKVDPIELQLTADQLDGHASGYRTAHQASHSRASHVALGAGASAAALPEMLTAWERDGVRFDNRFTTHAENHREAATRYTATDRHSADGIDDAGSAL